ncbi:MAG TPA: hypothetical protein ENJ19_04030 [Gammaproteobacteria bacterium]|nr:hypothetical protein [Gammaproteobacteria bacterium]
MVRMKCAGHRGVWARVGFVLGLGGLLVALGACSGGSSGGGESSAAIRLPADNQLAVDLPLSLTEANPVSADSNWRPTGFSLPEFKAISVSTGAATLPSDPGQTSFNLMFDPFFGEGQNSATQTNCPGRGPEEPPYTLLANGALQGLCFARAIRIALKRAVFDYTSSTSILTSIARYTPPNAEGTVVEYTNPDVQTNSGTGLSIQYKYQCVANCSAPVDQRDYSFTVGLAPLADKTRLIGRMDWTLKADGSSSGSMTVTRDLMQGPAFTCNQSDCRPPQIEFQFQSDPGGVAKSFVMKYAPISQDEFHHDASVIRIQRIPATDTDPALWVVQGTIDYALELGINPARDSFTWHAFVGGVNAKVHFSAVAEDVFAGGRALFNAVLADDSRGALTRSADLQPADLKGSHLWAAYKKLLKTIYTEALYTSLGLNTGRSAIVWNGDDANLALLPSFTASASGEVNAVAVSADGRRLASGGADGTLRIFDIDPMGATFGTELLQCSPHGGAAVRSVQFSADGSEVLTGGDDGRALRLASSDCSELKAFTHAAEGLCLARVRAVYTPDGTGVVSASEGRNAATVWHWQLDGVLLGSQKQWFMPVVEGTFDPNGTTYYCGNRSFRSLDIAAVPGDPGRFRVLTAYWDATARLWDPSRNTELIFRHSGPSDTSTQTVDVRAAFSPDGSEVFTTTSRGTDSAQLGLFHWAAVDASPVGGQEIQTAYSYQDLAGSSYDFLHFSPDGSRLLLALGGWHYFYSVPATPSTPLTLVKSAYITAPTRAASFYGPGNDVVFLGRSTGVVDTYNPFAMNQFQPFNGHQGAASRVSFSSDGNRLLTAGRDGTARLWSVQLGTPLQAFIGHGPDPDNSARTGVNTAFFADGDTKVVTAGVDRTARLWNATTGAVLQTYSGHTGAVNSAVFDPAFTRLVTAGADGKLMLWDPSGTVLATLANAHPGGAAFAVFSPDGTRLASGGADGVVRIWDATVMPPAELGSFNAGTAVNVVDFAPDGSRVAAGASDGYAYVIGADPADGATFAQQITRVAHGGRVLTSYFSRHDNGAQLLTTRSEGYSGNVNLAAYAFQWDIDPASPNFGTRLIDRNDGSGYVQNLGTVFAAEMSDGGRFVAAGSEGGRFQASWVDFDGLWARNKTQSAMEQGLWADENDDVNPYFMEPVQTSSASVCYEVDDPLANTCKSTCADIEGGCYIYDVESTYRHQARGLASSIDETQYTRLRTILDGLAEPWFTETFTATPIPPVN